ncbi:hypothetical protein ACP70R_026880 [Stipagrostis hirtigluma subsp. patula]
MPSIDSDGEGDDIFFEACDDIKTSAQASSSIRCSTSDQASASWRGEYEIWTSEPMSIKERRHRFLIGMGFAEPVPTGITFSQWQGEITTDCAFCDLEVEERISSICSSYRSSFSSAPESSYCIRDLDTGSRFIVHEIQHDGVAGILEEVGTDRLMIINQSEGFLKLSQLVQKFLRKGGPRSSAGASNTAFSAKKKDILCFCGRFTRKKGEARIPLYDVHMRSLKTSTFFRTKVDQQNKKWMDFSAVYMCQEIQAHGGSIRVMKFSTSGLHLATVGEDCIVRIWMIRVVESSPDQYGRETPAGYKDRSKSLKMKLGKGRSRALAIIPKKVFSILETPLHELHGHTSDILDMTWSKSDFLLTSSKDKTVRMWKVGCDSCLAVFEHRDYVTSVQFNPVDERYFISGSIDGKVRVWDASEKRVVDWDDTKDIITAVTYQPDGKGVIVGTVAGTCRFYDLSDGNMELKRIKQNKVVTGLQVRCFGCSLMCFSTHHSEKHFSTDQPIRSASQFSAGDPSRIVVSSTDSKIRVSEGVGNGITQKFEGRRGSKALLPPSLTSDGRYIVSAGADSNVYIWDFDAQRAGKSSRRVRSCELFFSDGVTSVAPWPGPRHDGGSGGDGEVRWSERRPTLCRDRECCSFGTWFFADGLRGSATWPEEKLLPSLKYVNCAGMDDCRRKVSAAWNTVVVTGSRDGVIRCFHNYGLPVKL